MRARGALLGVALVLALFVQAHAGEKQAKVRGDGRSIKTALTILNATSHYEGVHLEYVYIRSKFPGCEVVQQGLIQKNGRFYDELLLSGCRTKVIYFDVTQFLRPKKRR